MNFAIWGWFYELWRCSGQTSSKMAAKMAPSLDFYKKMDISKNAEMWRNPTYTFLGAFHMRFS